MVKTKLYRQNLTQKHTHIHSQKKGKGEKLIYPAPKVHLLNLGWFVFYSGIPQMQGTSSWLWSFNPLLLRLLGEISLSLLSLHSSWGSALDLAPLLCVGRLRASVLHSDRTGLKEQLLWGLWLTQAKTSSFYEYNFSLLYSGKFTKWGDSYLVVMYQLIIYSHSINICWAPFFVTYKCGRRCGRNSQENR